MLIQNFNAICIKRTILTMNTSSFANHGKIVTRKPKCQAIYRIESRYIEISNGLTNNTLVSSVCYIPFKGIARILIDVIRPNMDKCRLAILVRYTTCAARKATRTAKELSQTQLHFGILVSPSSSW